MSKTAKIEARVRPANLERYRQAATILQLEEMSDFVRRACDHLAFEVLDADTDAPPAAPARDLERKHVTPRPRKR